MFPDFVSTNWKQIKRIQTCCLCSFSRPWINLSYNSSYRLHFCFCSDFLVIVYTKKVDTHFIVFTDNNMFYYVVLWSDVCRGHLVTCRMILLQSFGIMTKDKSSHQLMIFHSCCHLHIAPRLKVSILQCLFRCMLKIIITIWLSMEIFLSILERLFGICLLKGASLSLDEQYAVSLATQTVQVINYCLIKVLNNHYQKTYVRT